MQKEFNPYEQALELKELGFDEPCFGYYINESKELMLMSEKDINYITGTSSKTFISAPTFSQAFRWFREKYNLFGCIDLQLCTAAHWFIRIDDIIINDYLFHSEDESLKFATYEEAELACLIKLIEIVKKQTTMKKEFIPNEQDNHSRFMSGVDEVELTEELIQRLVAERKWSDVESLRMFAKRGIKWNILRNSIVFTDNF